MLVESRAADFTTNHCLLRVRGNIAAQIASFLLFSELPPSILRSLFSSRLSCGHLQSNGLWSGSCVIVQFWGFHWEVLLLFSLVEKFVLILFRILKTWNTWRIKLTDKGNLGNSQVLALSDQNHGWNKQNCWNKGCLTLVLTHWQALSPWFHHQSHLSLAPHQSKGC